MNIKAITSYLYIAPQIVLCLLFLKCTNNIHEVNEYLESPEPALAAIEFSRGTLDPVFSKYQTEYTLTAFNSEETISLKITPTDSIQKELDNDNALLTINDMPVQPHVFIDPITLDLWDNNNNLITIGLSSNNRKREYQFQVNLVPNPNASFRDISGMIDDGTGDQKDVRFDGKYRDDLANHPGCLKRDSSDPYDANVGFNASNTASVPAGDEANIPGYPCAAKEYSVIEDTTKPIIILVHGNMNNINVWEEYLPPAGTIGGTTIGTESNYWVYIDDQLQEMLATKLIAQGYKIFAVDLRIETTLTLTGFNSSSYYGKNYASFPGYIDHGWGTPIMQSLIKTVITNNPSRKISIIAHSVGATIARDALRRLFVDYIDNKAGAVNPWPHLQDIILLNGSNHGASGDYSMCGDFSSMLGQLTCQFGQRGNFFETDFLLRLNGYKDIWSTPCGDGNRAFGLEGYCGDNTIQYTTIVTEDDLSSGNIRDEAVSEASTRLTSPYCNNIVMSKENHDSTGYISAGDFAHHFSGPRSPEGIRIILEKLAD